MSGFRATRVSLSAVPRSRIEDGAYGPGFGDTSGERKALSCRALLRNEAEGVSMGGAVRGGTHMTTFVLEGDGILKRTAPLTQQRVHEIQPFAHGAGATFYLTRPV